MRVIWLENLSGRGHFRILGMGLGETGCEDIWIELAQDRV